MCRFFRGDLYSGHGEAIYFRRLLYPVFPLLFQATARPSAREIEHKLLQVSQTPTWTNVAYHKYYS